jgi:hypothetical protein
MDARAAILTPKNGGFAVNADATKSGRHLAAAEQGN